MKEIPEADRPVVAKYLQTWDSNVTKEFQKRQEKIKSYEELGTIEDIQNALEWVGTVNENPVFFYETLYTLLEQEGLLPEQKGKKVDKDADPYADLDLPPAIVEKLKSVDTLNETLSSMAEKLSSFETAQETERNNKELDNLLKGWHTEHGDFDDDIVLMRISKYDESPEDAIKWCKEKLGSPIPTPRKDTPRAPRIFTGVSGGVPQDQVDFSKMTSRDKKAAIVAALQMSNQEN